MPSSGRGEPHVADAGFRALLRGHERAVVAAVNAHGFFVPMPAGLQDHGRAELRARSGLDLVVPDHRQLVIEAWQRTLEVGAAHTYVRLRGGGDAALHFFDLRPAYEVLVCAFLPDGTIEMDALPLAQDVIPRVGYQVKNETAQFTDVDDATLKMLGWSPEDFIGHGSLEFVHPDDHDRAIESWMDMLANTGVQRQRGCATGTPTARGSGWSSRTRTTSTTPTTRASSPRCST